MPYEHWPHGRDEHSHGHLSTEQRWVIVCLNELRHEAAATADRISCETISLLYYCCCCWRLLSWRTRLQENRQPNLPIRWHHPREQVSAGPHSTCKQLHLDVLSADVLTCALMRAPWLVSVVDVLKTASIRLQLLAAQHVTTLAHEAHSSVHSKNGCLNEVAGSGTARQRPKGCWHNGS